MLQTLALARQLRATGQFTVVAVTRPFGFEGMRRLAAADKMISELESIAQLVRDDHDCGQLLILQRA